MKKRILDLLLVYLAVSSLLLQTVSPLLNLTPVANAQESTQEVTSAETTPVVENSTPESTSTQVTEASLETPDANTQSPDASNPTETETPVPTTTQTEVTPSTDQPETTTSPVPNENSPPAENNSTSPTSAALTPESETQNPTGNEDINIVILENVSAPSIDLGGIEPQNSATLTTDKADYAPTDTALITGTGLNANTDYTLRIWSDDAPATSTETKVTSSNEGTFVYAYQLDGTYRPNYSAELKDSDGTVVASVTFTDSPPAASIEQCRNGAKTTPNDCLSLGGSAGWVNGNAGSSNSHYVEGYSIPYRAILTDLPIGTPVTITLGYDIKHSGAHAIDFLTHYNRLEPHSPFGHTAESINPTSGVAGVTGSTTTFPIPAPSSAGSPVVGQPTTRFNSLPAGEKLMTLFGGTITAMAYVSQGTLTNAQAESQISVTFTPDSSTAVLAWGGHIAQEIDWGLNKSAGGISGSPYHMRLETWTLGNLGNQDRSLSADAVEPPSSITIIKDAQPNDPQNFEFTATGNGISNFTLDDDSDSTLSNTIKFSSLLAGSFSVAETQVNGWTLSSKNCISDGTGSNFGQITSGVSINLAAGENVTCTFTNTKNTASIELKKAWSGTPGQTTLNIGSTNGGTEVISTQTGVDGAAPLTTGSQVVSTGTYYVSEVGGLTNYTSALACTKNGQSYTPGANNSVTLSTDDVVVCTFTNTRNTGSINVHKQVDNDGNGTYEINTDESANSLGFNWNLDTVGTNPFGTAVNNVNTGNHNVNENNVSGYHFTGWFLTADTSKSCLNPTGTTLPAGVAITTGQTTNITLCNQRDTGTVVVHKDVQGPNGEDVTDTSTDFTVDLDGSNSQNLTDNETYTYTNVPTGSHSVHETNVSSDYTLYGISLITGTAGNTGGLSFEVTKGQETHVYVTNRQKLAQITVKKVVLNSAGQTVDDHHTFTVQLNGGNDDSTLADNHNVVYNVNPGGPYEITEVTDPNYDNLGCKLDSGATAESINLTSNESITVTCTNQQKPGSISGYKYQSDGQTGIQGWVIGLYSCLSEGTDCTTFVTSTITNATGFYSFTNLVKGFYKVVENFVSTYTPVGVTYHNVTINPNDNITDQNFSNFKNINVTACKKVDADGSLNTSNDQVNKSGWTVNLLIDDQITSTQVTGENGCYTWENLGPNHTYGVSENVPAGWTALTPTTEDFGTAVDGHNESYTFINTQLGTIIVKKVMVGGTDSFDFTGDVAGTISVNNDTISKTDLLPGTYTAVESEKTGWALTDITCSDTTNGGTASSGDEDSRTATFNLDAGESVTCTFTNNKPSAQIDLTPLRATNKIGDNHEITANVQVQNGNGTWGPAADGTLVTFSITNTNGATATFVGGVNTCTTTSGTCSVTINSPTAGHVEVNATTSPEVLGITVTATTGTGGNNSADAQKDYVNARISISPNSATNEVGDDHNYTVKVEKSTTNGAWSAIEGAIVNAIVSPSTTLDVSDCNAGTDSNGECTVTVNSSSSGVFTINARSTVTVNGVEFKLQTNGQGENSEPATKTYVDAKIVLSPLTATNDINDPHTIYATVSQNPGTGFENAPNGTLVTFSLLNNTAGATFIGGVNTCTTTNGTCSVTINSSNPGNVDIHATTTFSVGGVSLTRASDGTHGSSNDANKLYRAGKIIIEKQTLPNGSKESFEFNPSWSASNFSISDGEQNDSGYLSAGTYSVEELTPSGWDLTSAICSDQSPVSAISLQANETVTCVFTNTQRGTITVTKYTDPSYSQQTFDFTLSGDATGSATLGNEDSKDFINLIPGTYSVSEAEVEGWDLTSATCYDQNERQLNGPTDMTLAAGGHIYCDFTNTQRGKIIVTKYDSDTEDLLSGWTINLTYDESTQSKVTGQDGQATFDNLLPNQSYLVGETLKDGWEQTYISCGEGEERFSQLDQDNSTYAYVYPGETTYCEIYNRNIEPILNISKVNNATTTKVVGDNVQYSITVTLDENGGPAKNVEVTDLLPDGFKYQSGSWNATINGSNLPVSEPTYHSPGAWQIGNMNPGDVVVLTYNAQIQSDVTNGTYYDIALAKGNPLSDTETEIYATAVSPGDLDPGTDSNFVGTDVTVTSNSTASTGYEAQSTQEVLGASTVLPATGTPTMYFVFGFATLSLGLLSLITGLVLRRKYE